MLDRARRVGGQKGARNTHSGERRRKIGEVPLQFGLSDIAQLVDADREGLAGREARARMRGEIGGKFPLVTRGHVEPASSGTGPFLAPGDPRQYVIGEVRLRQFAVIDDVEAARDLPLDGLFNRRAEPRIKCRLVEGLPARLRQDHFHQAFGTRQRPGMSRQNAVGTIDHGVPSCRSFSASTLPAK